MLIQGQWSLLVPRSSPLNLQGVLAPQICVIHAAYRAFVRLHMFVAVVPGLHMTAAWRSLSAMKQRQSSCRGSWRVSAAYKPSNFAHNSDIWFNTLPKYLKPNKQCLTENQQTKQRRLRAFVLDHKLKSEKSGWILIKRLIVGNAFRKKLSVFTFCTRYLPQSIFMLI